MSVLASDSTYLFIDGGHLMARYAENVTEYVGYEPEIDLAKVKSEVGALKAFYYDSLHDERKASESQASFEERLKTTKDWFEQIRRLEGFHLRLGSVSGEGKKLRQKQVDVLLAVDMLTHAFRGNMRHAVLLTGDLDFKPVIDALVQAGTYVSLYYGRHRASEQLLAAADSTHEVGFDMLAGWANDEFLAFTDVFPTEADHSEVDALSCLRTGTFGAGRVALYQKPSGFIATCDGDRHSIFNAYQLDDRQKLELYVERKYGPIKWQVV